MILQKTVANLPQPITTKSAAIEAQQLALDAYIPKSDADALALNTQTDLLSDFDSIDNQQTTVTTAFVVNSTQALISSDVSADLSEADQALQISTLITDENRIKLTAAVKYSVDMWRLQASFRNIQIMGLSAIGAPGCLDGPLLKPWILQAPGIYNATGLFKTFATAVASAVELNFRQWQDSVTVPGLPWYPSFIAVPGPFALPTPNIPMPLISCVSQNLHQLTSASQIEFQIKAYLPNEFTTPEMDAFVHMLSMHLANDFNFWMVSQLVMMVMGTGPVPTYHPPFVPVGMVVNGYVIPSPGHLVA